MTDGLSTLYPDLLGGSYDCVDRIVLNAYFRMGHDPGGFRLWWRARRLFDRGTQARRCGRIPLRVSYPQAERAHITIKISGHPPSPKASACFALRSFVHNTKQLPCGRSRETFPP